MCVWSVCRKSNIDATISPGTKITFPTQGGEPLETFFMMNMIDMPTMPRLAMQGWPTTNWTIQCNPEKYNYISKDTENWHWIWCWKSREGRKGGCRHDQMKLLRGKVKRHTILRFFLKVVLQRNDLVLLSNKVSVVISLGTAESAPSSFILTRFRRHLVGFKWVSLVNSLSFTVARYRR
jgi:hypothetical protein